MLVVWVFFVLYCSQNEAIEQRYTEILFTLFKNENEWQKTEPVPIPLPRAFRNFFDVKTKKKNLFYDWKSEIIPKYLQCPIIEK